MIQVIETIDDLNRLVWTFTRFDFPRVYVDSYCMETRESTRHKWKIFAHYNRLDTRNSTIKIADVPLPNWVIEACIKQITDSITVTKRS